MKSVKASALATSWLCSLAMMPSAYCQYQNQLGAQSAPGSAGQSLTNPTLTNPAQLRQWFDRYEIVRKTAQMTPSERERADNLLSQGLSIFIAGPNKVQAQKLLTGLVSKYQIAINQMKGLPLYPETSKLHRGYYQYFTDAKALFSDYLLVQDDLMAKDPRTGKRVMPQLLERKSNLENLERQIKQIDAELRGQYGIAQYHG